MTIKAGLLTNLAPMALAERACWPGPRAYETCGAPWWRITEVHTVYDGGSGHAERTPEEVNTDGKWAV